METIEQNKRETVAEYEKLSETRGLASQAYGVLGWKEQK